VVGKDLMHFTIGQIGTDGANYKAMEFCGEVIDSLPISGRYHMCNMAIEAGAKNGIIAPDQITIDYVKPRAKKPYKIFTSDPDAKYILTYEYDVTNFGKEIKPGDIFVAGKNLGGGSARNVPNVLKAAGISCIISASIARIFLRNAINVGIPVIISPEASEGISTGDQVEVNLSNGVIKNLTTGMSFQEAPLPDFIVDIIRQGGLVAWAKKKVHGKA